MNYILKQFDNDLLFFSMENTMDGLTVQIQSVNEEKKYLLPLDLEMTNESLARWLKNKTVPRNRAYVSYALSKWKGKLCSTCELFTSLNQSFIPIGRLIRTGGIEAVLKYYRELGEEYYQKLIDMLVFDAIILNEDRHFGNFGLLIDNHTNKIIAPAPIFDNGLSLLCYAMENDFDEESRYIETRQPATYNEFIEFVKPLMSHRQKDKVRKLLDFHFEKKTTFHINPNKLTLSNH